MLGESVGNDRAADETKRASDRTACLTLDLENDWYFEEDGYDHLVLDRIDDFAALVTDLDLPLSVFVVGKTLERYPEAIDDLARTTDSEFHLHSYTHPTTDEYNHRDEIDRGIEAYRDHFGSTPDGYRAPQGRNERGQLEYLERCGFDFDSSVFPSYRPGVYQNLTAPRMPHVPDYLEDLREVPVGVLPGLRIPFSQSYMKLFGRLYLTYLRYADLPDVMVFDSHLQDFYRTNSHDNLDQPLKFVHRRNLDQSVELFRRVVGILREKGFEFEHVSTVVPRGDR